MAQNSINEITTVIATHLKRETDEPFKRILAVKVDYWRSTLISRSLEKHPDQRNFFTQSLWLPMECHSPIPCTVPMPICNIMRSKAIVPMPLRFGTTLFDYVGSIDGNNPFHFASVGTEDILIHGKYSKNETFWGYTNKRIQIKSKINYQEKPIPMIRVDGVFDKPIDVMAFNCKVPDAGCDFWDDPYPITNDILQMVVQYILEIDFKNGVSQELPEVEVNPEQGRNAQ